MNWSAATTLDVPPGVVTWILVRPDAWAGAVTVIEVEELTTTLVPAVPLKLTADVVKLVPVKLVPVMVTDVPPAIGPRFGLTAVTVGAAT